MYRYFMPLLVFLCFTQIVSAKPVAYRDDSGQWRVIEDTDWPNQLKDSQKAIPGAFSLLRGPSGSTFEVTYMDVVNNTGIGFDDPDRGAIRRATVEAVLEYIDSIIQNTGSCQIDLCDSLDYGLGALATGGPFFFMDGPYEDPLTLIHLTTGSDPSPSVPDAELTIDFGYNWNDTTDAPGAFELDLYSVLLHELTHGLGIISLTSFNGSSLLAPNVFSTFDNLLYTGGGTKLWNASGVFTGPVSILTGSDGGVYFHGASAMEAFGGYPPIYAPNSWQSGSSIAHWDEGINPPPVMSYSIAPGTEKRAYLPFEIMALEDIGYTVGALGPEANLYDGSTPIANHGGPILFGTILLGSESSPSKTFTLINNGDEDLTTANLHLPGGFSLIGSLAPTIEPGASDSFIVELPSATLGSFSGTVSFTTNDADENPYEFTIAGTVAAPSAQILLGGEALPGDGTPVDFGTAVLGSDSPARTFSVKNTGNYALATSNLTVPVGYSVTETLAASIAPGASGSFTVKLATTATGTFGGSVSFETNDPENAPVSFAVTGQVAVPALSVEEDGEGLLGGGDPIDFGKGELGAAGPVRTFTVQNNGDYPLTTARMIVPEGFTIVESLAVSIAPGAADTFALELSTAELGTFSGSVSFETNDPDQSTFTLAATGVIVEYLKTDDAWLNEAL